MFRKRAHIIQAPGEACRQDAHELIVAFKHTYTVNRGILQAGKMSAGPSGTEQGSITPAEKQELLEVFQRVNGGGPFTVEEHKPLPGGFCPVSFKDGLKVVGSGFVTVQPKNLQDEAAALQLIKTLAITYMRNGQNGSLDFNKPELLASGKVFFLNTCPLVPATVEELKRSWRDSATWLILIVSCVFMVCWQLASLSLNPVGWAATSFYIANNRIVCFYTGATYVTQNRSDTSQERCIYYSDGSGMLVHGTEPVTPTKQLQQLLSSAWGLVKGSKLGNFVHGITDRLQLMLWPDVEGPNHPVELIALGLHTAVTHVRGEPIDARNSRILLEKEGKKALDEAVDYAKSKHKRKGSKWGWSNPTHWYEVIQYLLSAVYQTLYCLHRKVSFREFLWGVRNGVVHRNELSKLAIEQVDKLLRKTGDEMKQANVWIRCIITMFGTKLWQDLRWIVAQASGPPRDSYMSEAMSLLLLENPIPKKTYSRLIEPFLGPSAPVDGDAKPRASAIDYHQMLAEGLEHVRVSATDRAVIMGTENSTVLMRRIIYTTDVLALVRTYYKQFGIAAVQLDSKFILLASGERQKASDFTVQLEYLVERLKAELGGKVTQLEVEALLLVWRILDQQLDHGYVYKKADGRQKVYHKAYNTAAANAQLDGNLRVKLQSKVTKHVGLYSRASTESSLMLD